MSVRIAPSRKVHAQARIRPATSSAGSAYREIGGRQRVALFEIAGLFAHDEIDSVRAHLDQCLADTEWFDTPTEVLAEPLYNIGLIACDWKSDPPTGNPGHMALRWLVSISPEMGSIWAFSPRSNSAGSPSLPTLPGSTFAYTGQGLLFRESPGAEDASAACRLDAPNSADACTCGGYSWCAEHGSAGAVGRPTWNHRL